MKNIVLRGSAILVLPMVIATGSMSFANAQPYWKDSNKQIARSADGECLRTIYWTAENGLSECGDAVVEEKVVVAPAVVEPAVAEQVAAEAVVAEQSASHAAMVYIPDDDDGDGIANEQDDCPNTANGTATNDRGCVLKRSLDISNVEFAMGAAKLSANSESDLTDIANVLIENDHMSFEVSGHTDNLGRYSRNVILSDKRAESVRAYLISKGVAEDRLTAKGYGPDKPIASNLTMAGRAHNRRVELVLQ